MSCWGENSFGQLGTGSRWREKTAVDIPDASGARSVSAGTAHTCAILKAGDVKCWGYGLLGELGRVGAEQFKNSNLPVGVVGLDAPATALAVGESHTCAIMKDKTVRCWGQGSHGQLGGGLLLSSREVGEVPGIGKAVGIAAGQAHTCAVLEGGSVSCWGWNGAGQVGSPNAGADIASPTAVAGLRRARAVTAGREHTCARLADGSVWCWGSNTRGQLGDPKAGDGSVSPRRVPRLDDATDVSAGAEHTCAIRKGGGISCWGANDAGQLGVAPGPDARTPVTIDAGSVRPSGR